MTPSQGFDMVKVIMTHVNFQTLNSKNDADILNPDLMRDERKLVKFYIRITVKKKL